MSEPLSMQELDTDLCRYCPLPEESQGVHCYGGLPIMCEGRWCNEAYENYLDEYEEEDDNE